MSLLLVNPMKKLYTENIYQKYDQTKIKFSSNMQHSWRKKINSKQKFVEMIANKKNDLYKIAVEQMPIIGDIIAELHKVDDAIIAGMSGSGATCFALFDDIKKAQAAKIEIKIKFPSFWVNSARIIS